MTVVEKKGWHDADDRHETDFYPTPDHVLDALNNAARIDWSAPWFDPGVGRGALLRLAQGEKMGVDVEDFGTDLERQDVVFVRGDALKMEWPDANVIANPPFSLLKEFLARCQEHVKTYPGREAFVLHRSQAWQTGWGLRAWDVLAPAALYLLTWRPDFTSPEVKEARKQAGKKTNSDVWTYTFSRFTSTNDGKTEVVLLRRP